MSCLGGGAWGSSEVMTMRVSSAAYISSYVFLVSMNLKGLDQSGFFLIGSNQIKYLHFYM